MGDCKVRRKDAPLSFAARSRYSKQKRKCNQGLQRELSQGQQFLLALWCMTKSMTMSSRTLALPNAEKPRGGPSVHKGNAQQRLCPLKRPKHAKKPHSFLQAILRLRQRSEQRLRSPFMPWSLGGYLTNPPCKSPSDASQSSSTSAR